MRKIRWSPRALADRKRILKFWIVHNKSSDFSIKLRKEIKATVNHLCSHPQTGKPFGVGNIRMKLVRDYWIFYKYTDDEVSIVQISHPKDIYKDLK